jgi:2,4-dienoyl-CoA reductase-like NADH-dependent reductase (Old Yellow Enzyme family)
VIRAVIRIVLGSKEADDRGGGSMDEPKEADKGTSDSKGSAPSPKPRRHREVIEATVVATEIATAMISQSRDLIDYARKVIARPHIVVTAYSEEPAVERPPIMCERCGDVIETPGIGIMRGRTVLHVRCDPPQTMTG